MTILALDAAGETLSVALRNVEERRYFEVDAGLRHSERLMELVDAVLSSARMKPEQLDAVACMDGPGSFTGLRIGYAVAKGMSVALGIPFIAVSTLECIAYAASHWPGLVLPVMDAKKSRFFSAAFREGERLTEDADASVEALASIAETEPRVLLTGPGSPAAGAALKGLSPPGHIYIDPTHKDGRARELSVLAELKYRREGRGEDADAGPRYLRVSDAELVKGAKHG